tara:strand:- start:237238 stop:237852 length:615 start_codon:yes stop_codon:yes gene_type:complete
VEEFKAKFEGDVFNRLQLFNEELVKWNRKFSFTSIPEHLIFKRLIAPSAWLGNYLSGQTSQDIVDFGTGFGIPGIPMLIADNSNKYLLIDSHTKKTEFMRHILRSNILINKDLCRIQQARVEEGLWSSPASILVCRAAGKMEEIATLFQGKMAKGAVAYFFKGDNTRVELKKLYSKYPNASHEIIEVPEFFGNLRIIRLTGAFY